MTFGTVALSMTMVMWGGSMMITSSHTWGGDTAVQHGRTDSRTGQQDRTARHICRAVEDSSTQQQSSSGHSGTHADNSRGRSVAYGKTRPQLVQGRRMYVCVRGEGGGSC
jgi:hypothetical protein